MSSPIYLIGARGCGKTTVGFALAQVLNYAFCDMDHVLQQLTRQTVAKIIATEGWQSFRQRESKILKEVATPLTVIATGGGIVLTEENCRFMRESGRVVYLVVEPEVLAGRLVASPQGDQRPTLTGRPIADEIAEVLLQRDPLYQQTAHFVIHATQTPEQVVKQVLQTLSLAQVS